MEAGLQAERPIRITEGRHCHRSSSREVEQVEVETVDIDKEDMADQAAEEIEIVGAEADHRRGEGIQE